MYRDAILSWLHKVTLCWLFTRRLWHSHHVWIAHTSPVMQSHPVWVLRALPIGQSPCLDRSRVAYDAKSPCLGFASFVGSIVTLSELLTRRLWCSHPVWTLRALSVAQSPCLNISSHTGQLYRICRLAICDVLCFVAWSLLRAKTLIAKYSKLRHRLMFHRGHGVSERL